ncbi:hypothetical protein LY76DRAFT_594281 [Colletotrichum caudatum]|nr:hypothetical protein LY76DRAFT_594281 [Colletotrichum caudatum]
MKDWNGRILLTLVAIAVFSLIFRPQVLQGMDYRPIVADMQIRPNGCAELNQAESSLPPQTAGCWNTGASGQK